MEITNGGDPRMANLKFGNGITMKTFATAERAIGKTKAQTAEANVQLGKVFAQSKAWMKSEVGKDYYKSIDMKATGGNHAKHLFNRSKSQYNLYIQLYNLSLEQDFVLGYLPTVDTFSVQGCLDYYNPKAAEAEAEAGAEGEAEGEGEGEGEGKADGEGKARQAGQFQLGAICVRLDSNGVASLEGQTRQEDVEFMLQVLGKALHGTVGNRCGIATSSDKGVRSDVADYFPGIAERIADITEVLDSI